MANSNNSNRKVVPAAAEALNKFKYEVASEIILNHTSLATLFFY